MFHCEIFHHNFLIKLFLLSLTASKARLQDSPQQRCDQGLGNSDDSVCNDCLHTYDCNTGVITSCSPGMLCDNTIFEGCTIMSIETAPECYCTAVGCVGDPTNPDVAMNCPVINELPVTTVGPCNTTVGETIDLDTCSCLEQPCPNCGFKAINPAEMCPVNYEYCGDPDGIVISFECLAGLCFREDFCSCQDLITDCPACGFAPDPLGDDGSFCFCQTEPSACGLQCSDDFIFDTELCQCAERQFLCLDCGLRMGSSTDCSEYYECDSVTGENISGPYFCPGSGCFDSDTCACITP